MPYYVYILCSISNELYIEQTNNLINRKQQQLRKGWKAAKFIRDGNEFQLVYHEEYQSRLEAMRREKQLKGWSREKKEALIRGDVDKLKKLSKSKNL